MKSGKLKEEGRQRSLKEGYSRRGLGGVDRGRTGPDPTRKVLFVCTANISRSPIAEVIFNALVSDWDVPFEAQGAGTVGLVGEPMAPNDRAALEEVGVYTEGHRARQVGANMLEGADLVSAMAPEHAATLRRLFPESLEKIHTLPGYAAGSVPCTNASIMV
jgi:protein-tyrosine phosphatase